jgi:hypothetical protein
LRLVQKKRKETIIRDNESNEPTLPSSKTGRKTGTISTALTHRRNNNQRLGEWHGKAGKEECSCHGWLRKKLLVWKMKKKCGFDFGDFGATRGKLVDPRCLWYKFYGNE